MFLLDGSAGFFSQLLATLKSWDTWLFLKINNSWTTPFLDTNYPWWREASTWMPLYFFLIFLVLYNFGWKVWPWILFFIATVGLSDQISSGIIKNWVARPRPCGDDVLMYKVRLLLNHCPGSGSFTSSHATNHFAMACFLYVTLKPFFGKWVGVFFVWAATISYGQVYVGVHYPLDIICGALLGIGIGKFTATLFMHKVGWPPLLPFAAALQNEVE